MQFFRCISLLEFFAAFQYFNFVNQQFKNLQLLVYYILK